MQMTKDEQALSQGVHTESFLFHLCSIAPFPLSSFLLILKVEDATKPVESTQGLEPDRLSVSPAVRSQM